MTDTALQIGDINSLPDTSITCHKDIPLSKLIALRNKGLSYDQIAKIVNCSKPNVYNRLQQYQEEITYHQEYKDNKADIIDMVQHKLLNSLTEEDIQKASAYQKVGMFGILYDKCRLERGESTENVSYQDVTANISKLEEMLKSQGWKAPEQGK